MFRKMMVVGCLLFSAVSGATELPRCLLVYSYHIGYAWNDGIDRGATQVLEGQCEIRRFYMDSKRNPEPKYIEKKAKDAYALIEQWNPDVVIAADDNASKFLVVPYLKDHKTPVVFCGVNWTTEAYGYPFSNVTGMIEKAPLEPLFILAEQALSAEPSMQNDTLRHLHFIDADRLSSHKEYDRIREHFENDRMQFHPYFVETFKQWKSAFLEAQQGDLVMVLNSAGISGWEQAEAERFVAKYGTTLSIGMYDWMREFNMVTMAKEPEEQGEGAAEVAQMILAGSSPAEIPIASNRRWNSFVNRRLLSKTELVLPDTFIQRAQKVGE